MGRSCLKLQDNLPEDGDDFKLCVDEIDAGLPKLVGALDEAGYVRKWLKRGWMRFLLRHHNIKIDFKSVTVRTFIDIWPDEHKLLLRLLSDPKGQSTNANLALTVGDALENLGYEDDEEDLSMHACLIDDIDSQTVLRRKGPDWIPRNWVELRKRLDAWGRRDGIYPHPGVFFLKCMDLE